MGSLSGLKPLLYAMVGLEGTREEGRVANTGPAADI